MKPSERIAEIALILRPDRRGECGGYFATEPRIPDYVGAIIRYLDEQAELKETAPLSIGPASKGGEGG